MTYCIFQTGVMLGKPSQMKYFFKKLLNYSAFPGVFRKQACIPLHAISIFRRAILTLSASREQEECISTSKGAIPVFLILHLQSWARPLKHDYFRLTFFGKKLAKGNTEEIRFFLHKEKVERTGEIKAFI